MGVFVSVGCPVGLARRTGDTGKGLGKRAGCAACAGCVDVSIVTRISVSAVCERSL